MRAPSCVTVLLGNLIVLVTVRGGNPSVASIKLSGFTPKDLETEAQVGKKLLKAAGNSTGI